MTNEQVIGALNRIRCIIREDSIEEQALVYAIEALKAQGTNVGDIIYRQAAIEVIKRCKTAEQSQSGEVRNWTVDTCADAVKRLPSAQPESESISEWKKEFREYVDSLDIARDDWKGIIEYIDELPSMQLKQNEMIKEIRRWINSGNRGNADYFIVDRIEEIINAYEIN